MLEIRNVSVRFGDVTALDDVSLHVDEGEVVAVLGASGSGKSTLLRVVAGLTPPDSGTVWWQGADLAGTPSHERGFGLVFQDFALFPHLDVGRNVGFGLKMRNLPQESVAARVSAALEEVGLAGLAPRRIDELSGGQMQRVALARTLATEPQALLLDEPLGSLDPGLRKGLATDLGRTLAERPTPTLVVTHDTGEAFALADRIAVLDHGRVIRTGTPAQLWEDPQRVPVATLLGHVVIPGGVAPGLRSALGLGGGPIAIAPDAVEVSPHGPVEGTVESTSFRGPNYVTTFSIEGTTLEASDDRVRREGERTRLTIADGGISPLEA